MLPCRLVVVPIKEPPETVVPPLYVLAPNSVDCGAIQSQITGATEDPGIGAAGRLIECDVGVVNDVALQAGRGASQRTGRDRRATGVRVAPNSVIVPVPALTKLPLPWRLPA